MPPDTGGSGPARPRAASSSAVSLSAEVPVSGALLRSAEAASPHSTEATAFAGGIYRLGQTKCHSFHPEGPRHTNSLRLPNALNSEDRG